MDRNILQWNKGGKLMNPSKARVRRQVQRKTKETWCMKGTYTAQVSTLYLISPWFETQFKTTKKGCYWSAYYKSWLLVLRMLWCSNDTIDDIT